MYCYMTRYDQNINIAICDIIDKKLYKRLKLSVH